jgi:putative transposase
VRQCDLLGVNRSSYYYEAARESPYNEHLMRQLDEQYTQTPFYGVLRMTQFLRNQGEDVNPKRVRRLLRKMGLAAIYPKPKFSPSSDNSRRYSYLLRGKAIERPHQVWSTDITYIRLEKGFIYLVAVIDWYSRYVLSWEVSNTLDVHFCLEALETALSQGTPEIFNTDQGSQFTSMAFTDRLLEGGIEISQDGRGRALDNIFVERLWRSLKYEEVYLKCYGSVAEAIQGIGDYFAFYNNERLHQSLNYETPATVHNRGKVLPNVKTEKE